MIKKIQLLIKRTAIIFAMITWIQLALNTALNNQLLMTFLLLALVISCTQTLLFQEIIYNYSLIQQGLFLLLTWIYVIIANLLFDYSFEMIDYFKVLGIVVIIYIILRLISYYQIKDDAKQLNLLLKKRKDH